MRYDTVRRSRATRARNDVEMISLMHVQRGVLAYIQDDWRLEARARSISIVMGRRADRALVS